MIKNILHIGTPIVLGFIFFIKNVTDSTLAGSIAFFSFLACLLWGGLYNKGYFRESEMELMFRYWDKLDKERGVYTKRKEDFFPYKYDAWKCTSILIIYVLGWLVFVFFIEKKSSQTTNNENNNTVVDSSYTAPEEVSSQSYQVNYDTAKTNQSDTTNFENNFNGEDSNENYQDDVQKDALNDNIQNKNANYNINTFVAIPEDFIGKWDNWFGKNGTIKFDLDGKCKITRSSTENYDITETSDWYCQENYLYVKMYGNFRRFEITEKNNNEIKIENKSTGEFTYLRKNTY